MKSIRKALGQYMTPDGVAQLLAEQIPEGVTAVVDLAAGDCSLLRAASALHPGIGLYGCEIDPDMHTKAVSQLPAAKLSQGDGLTSRVAIRKLHQGQVAVVGNPPYTEMDATREMRIHLSKAFPALRFKLGHRRSELYFLARSLLLAKKTGGTVAVLMPMGFADGDIYHQYRQSLMAHYGVRKAIEVCANAFGQTEARTVLLVIDTSLPKTTKVEISRYTVASGRSQVVFHGVLTLGERLDARYHEGKALTAAACTRLADLGVTIVRGRVSHKESKQLSLDAIHTTDLARAEHGLLAIKVQTNRSAEDNPFFSEIVAETGDILLSRTGSRVSWKPILVSSGKAPITDHVFRIRVPQSAKYRVTQAFEHPAFPTWLASVAKGVCATVVTKRDLLTMPIFEPIALQAG